MDLLLVFDRKLKNYICSFTIDIENKETEKNRRELIKVEDILKTLKTK